MVRHIQNKSTLCIGVINKHLADAREVSARKANETIDGDNFKLSVDEKYHLEIHKIIRKHNDFWSDDLETSILCNVEST